MTLSLGSSAPIRVHLAGLETFINLAEFSSIVLRRLTCDLYTPLWRSRNIEIENGGMRVKSYL